MFVEVAVLRAAVDGPLTWAVPEALRAQVRVGVRVIVPLAGKPTTGVILGVVESLPEGIKPKLVAEVLDKEPVVDVAQLALARFVARYYECALADALRLVLPPDTEHAPRRRFRLTDRGERARVFFQSEGLNAADVALLQMFEEGLALEENRLKRAAGTRARLQKLVDKGLIDEVKASRPITRVQMIETLVPAAGGQEIPKAASALRALDAWLHAFVVEHARSPTLAEANAALGDARGKAVRLQALGRLTVHSETRDPRQADGIARLEGKGPAPSLTEAQTAAVEAISKAPPSSSFLLEGVTGSGKTEVYLRALQSCLARGRGALLLVPEIGLTPVLVARVEAAVAALPEDQRVAVVVLHSELSEADRRDGLQLLREGRARVAVGARSAVFAPVRDLGLIVVDEEHEPSLKQDEQAPRYHARDVALWRAQHEGAVCVLGSATPSFETRHNATVGKLQRLELPLRVGGGGQMPTIEIVDLRVRKELSVARKKDRAVADEHGGVVLSAPLVEAMAETLAAGEQVLLFLNKRGWSSTITCDLCGIVRTCPQCSVSLTLHRSTRRGTSLRCHQCGYAEPFSLETQLCPSCGLDGLVQIGTGTERVEAEVKARFPDARIARLDRDALTKHNDVIKALASIQQREVDVVVGTQMVAKGHDWPAVRLVGVVLADIALTLPDFRAAERAMALLTQVAGRAGRGELRGRVIVQTYDPRHPALVHLVDHDVTAFARLEMADREQHRYPPFSRLARVRIEHESDKVALDLAHDAASAIGLAGQPLTSWWKLSGPVLCPIERVQGRTRVQLLVFAKDASTRSLLLHPLRRSEFSKAAQRANARVVVDVDPVQML
ncbi:MAG: primosomal protein N' [Deltaproteobacteria bacterium]|nr:primosomal protein N' [Deltaproteobacteria bacterium]